jgi:prepilin-type N-terminal cleavage/methylation domain-containing protein
MQKAFTLVELIFVILIIGVLSAIAVPKFSGLTDNAKISAELSTAASVQVALDSCHGEWIINEGSFTCGGSISSDNLNSDGYPTDLGDSDTSPLNKILKDADTIKWSKDNSDHYYGPASDSNKGTSNCKAGKPCIGKYWEYNSTSGTFSLQE